jgi:predicted nucleotidyltransferase component of viral defense system
VLGLQNELVEKDFWVTEVLRVLAHGHPDVRVIFKGGTSLSKGFDLIRRMSEDVDILLCSTHEGLSNTQRSRILRALTDDVASHLRLAAKEERFENGRKLVSRFVYTDREMSIGSSGVMLELGFRGYPEPSTRRPITSYVAQYVATREDRHEIVYEELESFELDLLAPERTLLEKIRALHVAASSTPAPEAVEELRRMARYYYDVKMLLDDKAVRNAVRNLGDMVVYARDELPRSGVGPPFDGPPRPKSGYGNSPAFNLSAENDGILRDAYEAAMRFIFTGAPQPTLEACLATVREHAAIL